VASENQHPGDEETGVLVVYLDRLTNAPEEAVRVLLDRVDIREVERGGSHVEVRP
jgi:hypothetical protein